MAQEERDKVTTQEGVARKHDRKFIIDSLFKDLRSHFGDRWNRKYWEQGSFRVASEIVETIKEWDVGVFHKDETTSFSLVFPEGRMVGFAWQEGLFTLKTKDDDEIRLYGITEIKKGTPDTVDEGKLVFYGDYGILGRVQVAVDKDGDYSIMSTIGIKPGEDVVNS